MDYSYNYGYLQKFMETHHLQKKDILEALGSGDYVSLNKWLDGKVPVHVCAMLRFCNYYNIPLENFFCDSDGMPIEVRPTLPDDSAQLTPTADYGIKEGRGRGIVETRVENRVVTSSAQAAVVAEGLARQTEQRNRRDEVLAMTETMPEGDTSEAVENEADASGATARDNRLTEAILRLKLEHANEIRQTEKDARAREDQIRRECQASFDAERNRLMDIIERQNAELSKVYSRQSEDRYGIVVEDEPGMDKR